MTAGGDVIVQELAWRAPETAFAPFAGRAHAHLLHSGPAARDGAWSIIVASPSEIVSAADPAFAADPLAALRARIAPPASDMSEADLAAFPFVSGLIGFAGYEAARFVEPSLRLPASPLALPDLAFGRYEAAAAFSRRRRRAWIVGRDARACARLRDALEAGHAGVDAGRCAAPSAFGAAASNIAPDAYRAAVAGVIEDILDGEYYQANLSHRLSARAQRAFSSYDLFRVMARDSDADFAALLQYPEGDILSNSPERFFRIDLTPAGEQRIVAEPVKGTRPRGRTPAEDARLAEDLFSDQKDRAENVMIADLMRNDLSRICRDRSICEEAICELRSYANVHHLVSRISGVLRPGANAVDAFAALFPCGSITGAPKLAAMEAIARIEGVGRGPYCGAVGYIDDRGNADFAVAIRTAVTTPDRRCLVAPVGGGVTLQSSPCSEYKETIDKARDTLGALGVALPDAMEAVS